MAAFLRGLFGVIMSITRFTLRMLQMVSIISIINMLVYAVVLANSNVEKPDFFPVALVGVISVGVLIASVVLTGLNTSISEQTVRGFGGAIGVLILFTILQATRGSIPFFTVPVMIFNGIGFVMALMVNSDITGAKPGLNRAIPAAIIGFIIAVFLVVAIRAAQSLDPILDPGIALVMTPFFLTGFFMWGLGAFDPRMSEHHAHEPEGGLVTALVLPEVHVEHHDEAPAKPTTILGFEIWKVLTLTLLLMIVVFAFAMLPGGFGIQVVGQAEASNFEFAQNVTFDLPVGLGSFQGSQLAVFLGFILFIMLSLFAFGGAIGGLMYFLNRNVNEARITVPNERDLTPPAPARVVGRLAGGMARGLRRGLPNFFGNK